MRRLQSSVGSHVVQETAKLNTVLKTLTQQLVDMEHDLEVSEHTCDQYEELIKNLRAEVEKAKAAPHE